MMCSNKAKVNRTMVGVARGWLGFSFWLGRTIDPFLATAPSSLQQLSITQLLPLSRKLREWFAATRTYVARRGPTGIRRRGRFDSLVFATA